VNHNYKELRVGLIGLGLDAYWPQFLGLESRLLGYLSAVEEKIAGGARRVFNFGLLDTAAKALDCGHACRQNDIDILLVYVTTYALSSTLLPVLHRAKVPIVLLNLQPEQALDYAAFNRMTDRTEMTGEWLAYCSACPAPEIANVLKRLEIPFQQVTGTLHNDSDCWQRLEEWLRAAEVAHALSHSRMGLLGHYYSGMLDIATDLVQVSGRFGIHLEHLEVDELSALRLDVPAATIEDTLKAFQQFFQVDDNCSIVLLERSARTAAALDILVDRHSLDMLAYYYKGTGNNETSISSIILGASMLTGRGVPVAGEYEIKNTIAMKIMDLLGVGGSFTEYYTVDFAADLVLMGHDGPGHVNIAQDRIKVRPLQVYHGKVGSGLSVEMSVKHGPVTLLSVVEDKHHGFLLLAAEGESVPGAILEIGNTNSRYRFSLGARGFMEAWNSYGPAHHCAIGVGYIGSQIEKVAALLRLGFVKIC
jgi:L-arabinose isomerase